MGVRVKILAIMSLNAPLNQFPSVLLSNQNHKNNLGLTVIFVIITIQQCK
jgi:hypothetical protein